jgi:FeS assembly SUF system protein
MMKNNNTRDILDVSAPAEEATFPAENMPRTTARPTVSPQEGGYFLNKFLDQSSEKSEDNTASDTPGKATAAPTTPPANGEMPESPEALQANVVAALQEIYDPEIPVNIYELGLIYDVDVAEDFSVRIRMTLTTPHCPVAESMPGEVELKAASVPGVISAEVALVWEPAWEMSMMSDEARLELGLL